MSDSYVHLVGHVGRDADYTPNITGKVEFSMATNRRVKNQETGAYDDAPTWWRISVWGKEAEWAKTVATRGKKVLVHGECYLREYEHNGKPRASLEVNARRVKPLDKRDAAPESADPIPF
jgi:single-strand DNA-binding protein